jgi:hypothetical protein
VNELAQKFGNRFSFEVETPSGFGRLVKGSGVNGFRIIEGFVTFMFSSNVPVGVITIGVKAEGNLLTVRRKHLS